MDRIKVKMFPDLAEIGTSRSGIATVIRAYYKLADDFNIEFVSSDHDISMAHGGMGGKAWKHQHDITMLHGVYFTAQYPAIRWEWKVNSVLIKHITSALSVTSPSDWVSATLRREFKIDPYIVPHGVFFDEWQHNRTYNPKQVFWGKNRIYSDVCDPTSMLELAARMPDLTFVTTLAPDDHPKNVVPVGIMGEDAIKQVVQESALVMSTIRETWGILYMEAMASGTPVVSVNAGHVPVLAPHGVAGYCYREGNIKDMEQGVRWTIANREQLSSNCKHIARQYPWENSMRYLRDVFEITRRKRDAFYPDWYKEA